MHVTVTVYVVADGTDAANHPCTNAHQVVGTCRDEYGGHDD